MVRTVKFGPLPMDNRGLPDEYEMLASDVRKSWIGMVRISFIAGAGTVLGVIATAAIIAAWVI